MTLFERFYDADYERARDALMHASNTIESMKAIARAAIEAAEGK